MRILIVRHGPYDKFSGQKNLTEEGKNIIASSTKFIRKVIDSNFVIHSSPALRCIETSHIIEELGPILSIDNELDESSPYNIVDIFMDGIISQGKDVIIVTHKPIIDIILTHLELPEIDVEPGGFIFIIKEIESRLVAIFQPSIFLV